MSRVVELLLSQARELEAKASDGDWQMVKKAASAKLVAEGVSEEEADKLLEKLAEEVSPNRELELKLQSEYARMGDILTKVASHITGLEVKLSDKEVEIKNLTKSASSRTSVEALKDAFSEEDLEKLAELDPSLLEKMARTITADVPSYGGPSTKMDTDGDPMLRFCMS
jgi:membrane-associated HD superfamily phosphohydrolase